MSRFFKWTALVLIAVVIGLYGLAYCITYHPNKVESVKVSGNGGEKLSKAHSLKILSWNVQYMAGKNYVFYYDVPDNKGPDSRPSPEDIAMTFSEVVRVIKAEDPDIVLLQEVDVGSKHTDYEDQMAMLVEHLPEYHYSATTFYHKAAFVPHPKIMGSVGMSLGILSKYKVDSATRYELPVMPNDPVTRLFYFHRCVLECRLPLAEGGTLSVMDTHLDAFAQGSDTMQKQVDLIRGLLEKLDKEGTPWIITGDFNLLPPGQREFISPSRRNDYQEKSEIEVLTSRWDCVPNPTDCIGKDRAKWYSHFPNDPAIKGPDRTIDYAFHSALLKVEGGYIRQFDTLKISDHMPVVATFGFKDTADKQN